MTGGQAPLAPAPTTPAPLRAAVTGDGTTARSRARNRWRAVRWIAGVLAITLVVALVLALLRSPTSGTPYAPDNPSPNGAQALARILDDHGVHVTYTRSATDAAREATAGTTLAVFPSAGIASGLDAADLKVLSATRADLALVGPSDGVVAALAPALAPTHGWGEEIVVAGAGCADPDARAALAVTTYGTGYRATRAGDPRVTTCFQPPGAPRGVGSYAVAGGTRRVAAFDDPAFATNADLALQGNAALALRMLGRNAHLVWLAPAPPPTGSTGSSGSLSALVPPWFWWVALWGVVVAALAVWWRGPRLGRLVPEDLPVVVRSSETTRGRGRLYRVGGARGHAAAALRAAAIDRIGRTVGLPRSAQQPAVISAVTRASGWDEPLVTEILYGPPPTDDDALLRLARLVDTLESEVHP